jgi:protein phosphatase
MDGSWVGPSEPLAETHHRILTVCGGTNRGAKPQENQDTFVVTDLSSRQVTRPCIRTDVSVSRAGVLMLVCDGAGGPTAGSVAAQLAAAAVKKDLEAEGDNVSRAPVHALTRALAEANEAILDEAQAYPEKRGMSATCTAAILSWDRLAVAQVGDSRAYLVRRGRLHTLTRDQTVASELLDAGILRPDQIETFRYGHVLAQALGIGESVAPVISSVNLRESDRVLLCSDGLHRAVSDDAIGIILNRAADVGAASNALIAAALAAGGPDNITVVVADCGPLKARAAPLRLASAHSVPED